MAANQPGKKDVHAIVPGSPQSLVRAELGTPVWCGKEDHSYVEIYHFTQGYSKGAKAATAVLFGAADVCTLGLWEVAGTPIEALASGTKMTVKVIYDHTMHVRKVIVYTPGKTTEKQAPSGYPKPSEH